MTRKECLEQAMGCVLRDRNNEYGEPEQSFHYIADLWSAYLRTKIEPYDAAAMMALFKLARLRFNPYYEDGWTDLAGYAACGAELAGKAEAYKEFIKKCDEEYKKLRAESEAKDEADEEPKFKSGDRVQCRVTLPSVSDRLWVDGEYVRYEKGLFLHHVVRTRASHVELVSDEDIRPAPKAEGCEDLVFNEARMRESMPGIVPQDGPSDMDKPWHPHTPTGEELAEMAEEELHG